MKLLKQMHIKNFLMLTLAGAINAFGIVFFLYPVQLYDSGISGTSMLMAQITPPFLPLSLFLAVLNVPLFLYGLKKQGAAFTIYALYAVGIYALSAWLMMDVLPVDVTLASPLAGTDLLLCALFGGIISGVGSGLAIRYGGAMDGIEVVAVIFAKKLGITVGTFCMIYNVLLYVVCGVVLHSWILPLYSIVTYAAALKTVDFIVDGVDRAKAAMIVTVRPDEICDALSAAFETGATVIDAKGGYSRSEKTVVYFVVNRFQVSKMKTLVHEIDPTAYITINEVVDVFSSNLSVQKTEKKEETGDVPTDEKVQTSSQ
ncbi:MAG: YitT family protein [Clostridia bacterium]|nr:YitT family protein [Clostridia bacterium]